MATAAPNTPSELTTRYALKFFWPLALSWLFMSVEGPTCVGFLSRTANPVALTAAFNLLMSLALFMESPIIDLLTTATTLASSPVVVSGRAATMARAARRDCGSSP